MRLNSIIPDRPGNRRIAFTLAEVVISLAIVATVFGGILVAYTQAAKRAEWSGYSLAAQALAIQQVEQARCGKWDGGSQNDILNLALTNRILSNYPGLYTCTGYSTNALDMPTTGNNFVRATNYVTIKLLNFNGISSPNVQFQMIKVDTVWPFVWNSQTNLFTNTICTYLAPDNRDNSTL